MSIGIQKTEWRFYHFCLNLIEAIIILFPQVFSIYAVVTTSEPWNILTAWQMKVAKSSVVFTEHRISWKLPEQKILSFLFLIEKIWPPKGWHSFLDTKISR